MAQPIYRVFLVKPTEAWYQLSKEERSSLGAKVDEAFKKGGGKQVVFCSCRWASGQWAYWGVEAFPDIEAVQKYTGHLGELNWQRYTEGITVLGTEMPAA